MFFPKNFLEWLILGFFLCTFSLITNAENDDSFSVNDVVIDAKWEKEGLEPVEMNETRTSLMPAETIKEIVILNTSLNRNITLENVTESNVNINNKTRRIECTIRIDKDKEPQVKIVNASVLFEYLESTTPPSPGRGNISEECVIVFFYFTWCHNSADFAPAFNLLGRVYPQFHVLAIDTYLINSINMRYGLIGVPSIVMFKNGRVVAKYNNTSNRPEHLVEFFEGLTEIKPINLESLMFSNLTGPLPHEAVASVDYILLMALVFNLFTVMYLISISSQFKKIIDYFKTAWSEVEDQQHEHID